MYKPKEEQLTKEQILSIARLRREKGDAGHLKTNAEIAKELGVSVPTIIRWVKRIRESGRALPKRKGGFPRMEL